MTPLNEDDFAKAMREMSKGPPGPLQPKRLVMSPHALRHARDAATALEQRRDRASGALDGTRRWRWLKRYRLMRAYIDCDRNARAMRATFGEGEV